MSSKRLRFSTIGTNKCAAFRTVPQLSGICCTLPFWVKIAQNGAFDRFSPMETSKINIGTYCVVGYKPDGDSIRFQADNAAYWDHFAWEKPEDKAKPRKQLRIEAVDALETHYDGFHQPRPFAIAALEKLLAYLRITDVRYSLSVATVVAANDGQVGYIAAAELDAFSRLIAFLFPAETDLPDGSERTAEQLPLELSVNFRMLADALVYPTLYTTTHPMVVEKFRAVTVQNRQAEKGLWAVDRTRDFTVWDVRTVQDDTMILPKLFRRLAGFFDTRGDFGELPAYIKERKDNLRLIKPNGTTVASSFAKLLDIQGRRIRLKEGVEIEDLLFSPK